MSVYVSVDNICKSFGSLSVLDQLSFSIARGELVSLVGPSGSGKTTLLRILAGIETPNQGSVYHRDAITRDHPAILVFQDYLLFPHMTVIDNVSFGLRARRRSRRIGRSEIVERSRYYLEQLGVGDKEDQFPAQLSGGQRQRVALARALVMEPRLLLLDEPFANLDNELKRDTARFIRDLQQRLGVTTVVVSHDVEEASEVSDRIDVLVGGQLLQMGTFSEIYRQPATLAVARMFGTINVVPAALWSTLSVRAPAGATVCTRAENTTVVTAVDGAARVLNSRLIGGNMYYEVDLDGWCATAYLPSGVMQRGDRCQLSLSDTMVFAS